MDKFFGYWPKEETKSPCCLSSGLHQLRQIDSFHISWPIPIRESSVRVVQRQRVGVRGWWSFESPNGLWIGRHTLSTIRPWNSFDQLRESMIRCGLDGSLSRFIATDGEELLIHPHVLMDWYFILPLVLLFINFHTTRGDYEELLLLILAIKSQYLPQIIGWLVS